VAEIPLFFLGKAAEIAYFCLGKKEMLSFKYQFYPQILPIPARNGLFSSEIGTKSCR
jgi:hypothetical protein